MADGTALDRFLSGFVLPLTAGGRVEVDGLLGPGMLAKLIDTRTANATLIAKVMEHARSNVARLGPVTAMELLPPDGIALAMTWHNLLSMTHPEVLRKGSLRRKVREWCEQLLTWAGIPRTAEEVAGRHGLLARIGEAGRVDTDVVFWAGSARYVGVSPPARLTAWKGLRRVRETRTRVPLFELLVDLRADDPGEDLCELARVALALSPLTDLALIDRPAAVGFRWTPALINALGDSALRGAATRIVLARPGNLTADRAAELPNGRVKLLEAATRGAASTNSIPGPAARMLLRWHLELLATEALGRNAAPAGHALAWDAVLRLGVRRVAELLSLDRDELARALGLDAGSKDPVKDAPAAPLLARAGYPVEVTP